MAKQTIDLGTVANDGTGTPLRSAFDICNDNFDELYAGAGGGTPEGTEILSTGETVGKVLQADGDDTSSWVALAGGGNAQTANPLSQFAATTSAQLAGVLSDETGTGAAVFSTSPTLVTPALGTPSALVATNATGTAAGLTVGNVTNNANLTGHITSTGNAAVLGSFTVGQLSTALTDASISGTNTGDEVAASATVSGVSELATITEIDTGTDTARTITPAGLAGSALQTKVDAIESGADVTDASNVGSALTLTGDVTSSGSMATTIAAGAVDIAMLSATGTKDATTFLRGDGTFDVPAGSGGTPEGTAVLSTGETIGKVLQADGDDSSSWVALAGGGNAQTANPLSQFAATTSAQLAGVLSDETGSGLAVFGTSPTLVTPALGTPSALVGTNITGTAAGLTVGATTGVEAGADVTDAENVGSSIAGATAKSALVDADSIATIDSEAANVLKETTWTNVKAFLKTYFDGLYGAGDALVSNPLSQFAATTAAQLNGVLSDASLTGTNTGDEAAASTTVSGIVELATLSEVNAGTDTVRSVTPAGLATIQAAVDLNTAKTTYPGLPEGTAVLSTGETIGKVLQADGDDSSSWVTLPGGGDAQTANPLSQFAATTSAQLAGVLSDETGTGLAVFGTSPTLVTPALGTPSALVGTNITGTAAGLTVGATTGVEAGADVTDTANVTSAGALMDSEVTNLAQVKAFDTTDYATAAQGTTADGAIQTDASNDADGLQMLERADHPNTPAATKGQFWTKNTVANRPIFTDDGGTDYELLRLDGGIAASDETTALTASTSVAKTTIHAQRAGLIDEVLCGVTTAPTGSTLTLDVHLNGTTIFSTKPTIDAAEKTTVTAATASVLTTTPTVVAKGDLIEFFADSVGATIAGAGLKFYINYTK